MERRTRNDLRKYFSAGVERDKATDLKLSPWFLRMRDLVRHHNPNGHGHVVVVATQRDTWRWALFR